MSLLKKKNQQTSSQESADDVISITYVLFQIMKEIFSITIQLPAGKS